MNIKDLGIIDKKVRQLEKVGINTAEELLCFFPRKYVDRREPTGILPPDKESVFYMVPQEVIPKYGKVDFVFVKGVLSNSSIPIKVIWFNQAYLYNRLLDTIGKNVLVCGCVTQEQYKGEWSYKVASPSVFDATGDEALGIYPLYKNVPGMALDYLKATLRTAADNLCPLPETIPEQILAQHNLMSYNAMVQALHWPTKMEDLEAAQRRRRWDDLLYFALRIELAHRNTALGSPYNLPDLRLMRSVEKSLPFTLTADQKSVLEEALGIIRSGERLDGLIQGDVGCGKTIIAFLLMLAFAENGCQAVLMAPTQILAQQHYEGLRKIAEPLGLPVAFVSGQKLRKAERLDLETGISSGRYKLIVGTQALLTSAYQFNRLALILEDEEHKYGVLQRQALADKAAEGVHTIELSATPIPRTLALAIHGNRKRLFNITSKPAGRIPVKTGIARSIESVYQYLRRDITGKKHQAYVVCPMISANEKIPGVAAVEEVYENYRRALSPFGIQVSVVTGKTKKEEAAKILRAFENNEISVLVSTTVVEVGVNIPNATTMVIHNAERFGLAQLHQLRGRVGRGTDASICVLVSEERENERLTALCNHSDGFKIAEIDLELRGAGNFLGTQQSGTERYLALALSHPKEYEDAQKAAVQIVDGGVQCAILEKAITDWQENAGGEMIA